MNTKEAYKEFKKGKRVGVIVTNAIHGDSVAIEISDKAWRHRLVILPDNTNYTILKN